MPTKKFTELENGLESALLQNCKLDQLFDDGVTPLVYNKRNCKFECLLSFEKVNLKNLKKSWLESNR